MRLRLLIASFAGLILASTSGAVFGERDPSPPAIMTRRLAIDYAAALQEHRRTAAFGVTDDVIGSLSRAELDREDLPVLVPADPTLMKTARIYSMGGHYTISADLPTASIVLAGYAVPVELPFVIDLKPLGPENLTVVATSHEAVATFTRYGVLYTAEIDCDLATDKRCTDEDFIRLLATRTTYVVLGEAALTAAARAGG